MTLYQLLERLEEKQVRLTISKSGGVSTFRFHQDAPGEPTMSCVMRVDDIELRSTMLTGNDIVDLRVTEALADFRPLAPTNEHIE